jgi:transposase
MGINVATEQDIERLRIFSELQARELTNARRKLAALATKLAEREGLDPQAVLEQILADIAGDVNAEGRKSPLDSNSERWSGDSTDAEDEDEGEPQRGHGPTDQPDLPVQEVLCELDEADRMCPECGGDLQEIEGLTEDSTEIDVVEVQYVVRQVNKQKYRCTCSDCQHIETALGPDEPKPVKGGRYTGSFAVEVILDKYASHLPLARQSRRMKAQGLTVSSQTLWDYTWACARWLEPTWEMLQEIVLDEEIVGADETRWRLMGKKRNAKPSIIALTSDAGVWYGFEHDKTAETIDRLLGDFSGVLIADGLAVYPAVLDRRTLAYEQLETEVEPFTLAQCWVHARRNYIKASRGDPDAGEMVRLIGRLYRLKRAYDPELGEVWLEWVDVVLGEMRVGGTISNRKFDIQREARDRTQR